jgi:MFS family permease
MLLFSSLAMADASNTGDVAVSAARGNPEAGEARISAASASYVRLPRAELPSETRLYLEHAAICCLSCASADVGGSLFAPFFPAHAAERGLSSTLIGVIFALPMISMLLVTPLVPQLQRSCGVRLTLIVSMLAQAACIFAFGFVDWLPHDPAAFSAACLAARAVLGVASAGSEVAATTILISSAPPSLRAQSLGWAEAARGLGSMLGPPLGGLLFQYGGFPLPFFVVGAANALLTLPLLRLPKASPEEKEPPVSICAILRLPPAIAGAAVVCGAMVAVSFLEPTLQPFLAAAPFYISEAQVWFPCQSGRGGPAHRNCHRFGPGRWTVRRT